MRRLFVIGAIIGLFVATTSICFAAKNLNSSKSNVNRVVSDGMTSTQVAALRTKLDTIPRVDEAAVRKALQELSIPTNFKLIRIIPGKPNTVLLLMNPANANEARIAVGDPGPDDPPFKPPIKK